MITKVLAFPKDANPYQELLYQSLPPELEVQYLDSHPRSALEFFIFVPRLIIKLIIFRIKGFNIIHIHWLYPFNVPKKIPFSHAFAHFNTLLFIYFLKLLGIKIVWTVHNILPHERQAINDLSINRTLARLASAVIVHSSKTKQELKSLGINNMRSTMIPIGPYDSLYSNNISRKQARKILNIKEKEFVILFFGIIRPYKGLDDLLSAFQAGKFINTKLIIAGKSDDVGLSNRIRQLSAGMNVDFYDEFIPDDEVSTYFNASDIVCLPFKKITTSSSILLAMSFKKATIAPRLGALVDLPKDTFVSYDPSLERSLEYALKSTINDPGLVKRVSRGGYEYSKTLSWDAIGKQTADLFNSL